MQTVMVETPSGSSEQDPALGFGLIAVVFATIVIGVIACGVCLSKLRRKLDKPQTGSLDPTDW